MRTLKRVAKRVVACGVLAAALSGAGCSRGGEGVTDEPHPVQSAAALRARLDTVLRVPVPPARDAGLQQIARDAAASGQVELCGTSLGKITAPELRHGTTDACVATLTRAGNRADADKLRAMPGVQ